MADYASWAHPTYDEGGVLPTGTTVTFRCPSDRGVVYVNDDSPLEGAACEHDTFSHVGPCPDSPPVVIDGEDEDDPPDYDG